MHPSTYDRPRSLAAQVLKSKVSTVLLLSNVVTVFLFVNYMMVYSTGVTQQAQEHAEEVERIRTREAKMVREFRTREQDLNRQLQQAVTVVDVCRATCPQAQAQAQAQAQQVRLLGSPRVPPAPQVANNNDDVWGTPPTGSDQLWVGSPKAPPLLPPSPLPAVPVAAPPATAAAAAAAAAAVPPPLAAPADSGQQPTALLVICYNRPKYLQRGLASVLKHLPQPGGNPPAIYVSQDGAVATVTRVIEQVQHQLQNDRPDVAFTHLRHKQERRKDDDHQGYSKLSRHFGWALNQLFLTFHHPRVIILEDDLEVAPDFFQYFNAVAPLLDADPTLLGATAWNDIGQPAFVHDPHTLYRSDFFGGLGWMLNAKMWAELGPKWPTGYWDDWLREPPQRQGRAFIRPEVSRSYTFGKQGVSGSQFFDRYLGNIKLNNDPQTWTAAEVQQLARAQYDPPFLAAVNNAVTVSVTDAVRKRCSTPQDIRVLYNGFGQGQGYVGVARAFKFIEDVKAKVPRTAYHGVVTIHHNGCRVFITPPGTIQ